ncbi:MULTISPECIES: hypothetical protein [Nostocales]|uniref:Uncharacterized protein n=3 Tax=Nostocales TaxID=1161 RepID=A0A8S9TEJ4_9CYAN|nr:hypothetical protein [Tolypothrix bouteillei]KAF3889733.1 hypothetical protein DA73_0400032870 [Tolypothrix bouteillei VB521301]
MFRAVPTFKYMNYVHLAMPEMHVSGVPTAGRGRLQLWECCLVYGLCSDRFFLQSVAVGL